MKTDILFFICCLLSAGLQPAACQPAIDSTAYTRWHRPEDVSLSDNGRWVKYRYAYVDNPEKEKASRYRYHFWDRRNGRTRTVDSISGPAFFAGGNWIHFTGCRSAEKGRTCLMDLVSGKTVVWKRKESLRYDDRLPLVSYRNGEKAVIFLNLASGDSIVYRDISQYQLVGDHILYLKRTEDAVCLRYGELSAPGSHRTLFRDGERLLERFDYIHGKGAFEISGKEDGKEYCRYYGFGLSGRPVLLADTREWKIPDSLSFPIRNVRKLGNGSLWELQTGERRKRDDRPEVERDTSFRLQLWSWQDPVIQSEQAVSGYREERPEPDRYVYSVPDGRLCRLPAGGAGSCLFQPVDTPRFALFIDNSSFRGTEGWRHLERKDLAVVDLCTGRTDFFSRQQIQRPFWSRNGDYIIFYDDVSREWKRIAPSTREVSSLTGKIPYPVHDLMYDKPHAAPPYGLAGWSKDGRKAYIYDQFDIWEVDMDHLDSPVCYTRGIGRRDSIVLRFMSVNYEDNMTVGAGSTAFLHILDRKTRASGLAVLTPSGKLQKQLYGDFSFRIPAATADRHYLLLSRQSFTEGRNIWLYETRSRKCRKVTDANPAHNGYPWGSVRLVEWTNGAGKPNQGLVYFPAGYVKGKEYPMVVNYYETHADEKHVYHMPDWCSAMLDVPTFLSRGYIIFRPDVLFETGYPARSAYNAVVSGVEYLVREGIATPGRIGVQGHSWSGCTVASLITMTDIFSCASIGAGVVNMTEAYTALRIGSGSTRMFMYEDWQSRIGSSLWENPEAYLRNSAIFRADRIHTPVLIMHNDKDEAVEFHEGRNLYLALRRLHKPVWLLNYQGEGHFIWNPAAQRDWTRRMLQFFDRYLNRAGLPRWMAEGINVNEQDIDRKLDLLDQSSDNHLKP